MEQLARLSPAPLRVTQFLYCMIFDLPQELLGSHFHSEEVCWHLAQQVDDLFAVVGQVRHQVVHVGRLGVFRTNELLVDLSWGFAAFRLVHDKVLQPNPRAEVNVTTELHPAFGVVVAAAYHEAPVSLGLGVLEGELRIFLDELPRQVVKHLLDLGEFDSGID